MNGRIGTAENEGRFSDMVGYDGTRDYDGKELHL